VVGVEDGGFSRASAIVRGERALLICVLMEGTWVEDVRGTMIAVDGLDATEKLCAMLKGWSYDAVMLAGVSFAGFNLVNPRVVYERYGSPVVVISRTKPNNVAVRRALLHHFSDWEVRWSVFEELGQIYETVSMPNEPPIFVEVIGAELDLATVMIQATSACCRVPEPIRVARLVARGLTLQKKNQ